MRLMLPATRVQPLKAGSQFPLSAGTMWGMPVAWRLALSHTNQAHKKRAVGTLLTLAISFTGFLSRPVQCLKLLPHSWLLSTRIPIPLHGGPWGGYISCTIHRACKLGHRVSNPGSLAVAPALGRAVLQRRGSQPGGGAWEPWTPKPCQCIFSGVA